LENLGENLENERQIGVLGLSPPFFSFLDTLIFQKCLACQPKYLLCFFGFFLDELMVNFRRLFDGFLG